MRERNSSFDYATCGMFAWDLITYDAVKAIRQCRVCRRTPEDSHASTSSTLKIAEYKWAKW